MHVNNNFFNDLFSNDFNSEYDHSCRIEDFNGRKSFHIDCSGFMYWCLAQMGYRRALVELRAFLKENDFIKINRFFCKDFAFIYEHADRFRYWRFLKTPTQDSVLVVMYPDGQGHCMWIDNIINSDETEWLMRVIDSTRFPHKHDSRIDVTGIGIGDIKIIRLNNGWIYDSGNPLLPPRAAKLYFVSPVKQV